MFFDTIFLASYNTSIVTLLAHLSWCVSIGETRVNTWYLDRASASIEATITVKINDKKYTIAAYCSVREYTSLIMGFFSTSHSYIILNRLLCLHAFKDFFFYLI